MRSRRRNLSVTLPLLVMLSWGGCAQAFSFCFSFGGGGSQRSHYNDYRPAYPRHMPGLYGGYPYSPVPAYPGYGGYYSLPYAVSAPEPVTGAAAPEAPRE
jgi:hypothetical protein